MVAETALKDDFDDFEEGGEDEDFGDFDDGFPVDEPVKSGGDLIEETVLDPSWSLFATKVVSGWILRLESSPFVLGELGL